MEIKRVKHYMTIKQSPTASPFSPCRPWSPEGPCNPFSPICPGLSEKGNVSVHSASWNQLKSPNYEQDNSKPSPHGVITCPARPKFNLIRTLKQYQSFSKYYEWQVLLGSRKNSRNKIVSFSGRPVRVAILTFGKPRPRSFFILGPTMAKSWLDGDGADL